MFRAGARKRDRMIMHNEKKDSELIAEYYDMYEQKVYRLAYAVLGDAWQAEEAVQETFLKLISCRDMVRRMSESKRTAYITKMAKNIAIDMYRSNKRASESVSTFVGDETSAETLENAVWNRSADFGRDMADEVEKRQLVKDVLERLSGDDALILQLRIIRQLSVRETSAIMNMSESAVRKRYERAIKRAHKLLVKEMMLYGE